MKILIIEDHYEFVKRAINAIQYDEAGEDTGVLITATASGEVAQRLLLQEKWDWVLLDHDLPNRWSGWVLLNNASPWLKDTKIIAISAVPENNKRLLQHGAHYQVAKMDGNFEEEIKKIMKL